MNWDLPVWQLLVFFLGNSLSIQDSKYPAIASHTSIATWGFYDKSFKNQVILGIDRNNTTAIPYFVATVTVQITSTQPLALSGSPTVYTKTLTISYEGNNDHQSFLLIIPTTNKYLHLLMAILL